LNHVNFVNLVSSTSAAQTFISLPFYPQIEQKGKPQKPVLERILVKVNIREILLL